MAAEVPACHQNQNGHTWLSGNRDKSCIQEKLEKHCSLTMLAELDRMTKPHCITVTNSVSYLGKDLLQ